MRQLLASVALVAGLFLAATALVLAHQPYFEETDITFESPWTIDDPTISTALYATLETPGDVDYFVFEGQEGQNILLSLVIPQIEGQQDFAPTMALMGPGLPTGELPSQVDRPQGTGVLEFPSSDQEPSTFFEPFTQTSYWQRQEERVSLPATGQYMVAVWHPQDQVGRYVFVIGDREVFGGDPEFRAKLRDYWTPVVSPTPTPDPVSISVNPLKEGFTIDEIIDEILESFGVRVPEPEADLVEPAARWR